MKLINAGVILFAIGFMIWTFSNYFRVRKAAKFITNSEFKELMHQGQIIDLRAPESFRQKHILGARNFNVAQLKESLGAIRRDKAVLLYDNRRSQAIVRAVLILKKAGYSNLYVLRDGIDYWDGKVK